MEDVDAVRVETMILFHEAQSCGCRINITFYLETNNESKHDIV